MVSGHLAVKKNRWYAILCLRHPDGRRYDKWIATGLSYPGNKRKAEAFPFVQKYFCRRILEVCHQKFRKATRYSGIFADA